MAGFFEQARVLRYWRAIELFSSQKVARVNVDSAKAPVFDVGRRAPLPWSGLSEFPVTEQGFGWRFTAYCGLFQQARVRAALENYLGGDAVQFEQRADGQSCLFSVQITGDGRPVLDTFVMASCGWAVGRLVAPGPGADGWLDGFEAAMGERQRIFAERFAVLEDDEFGRELNQRLGVRVGRPIEAGELEAEVAELAHSWRVDNVLEPAGIRLAGRQVNAKFLFDMADSDDFLNSFFLNDLSRVAEAVEEGQGGCALSSYLTPDEALKTHERRDVKHSYDELWSNLSPGMVPVGRWPAEASRSLYFSQQFAINSAMDEFRNGAALFGVNGPPGTGKTTLLRDVIAAVIVERARILAGLGSPEEAFGGQAGQWKTGGYSRCVHQWREDLLGFGIVVASSNNRAVENVSLEIPTRGAIAEEFCGRVDYFADFASRVLGDDAWCLIAARLGSKKNRRKFANHFWWADKDADEPRTRAQRGFQAYLRGLKAKPGAWKKVVGEFQAAVARESAIRSERVAAFEAVEKRASLRDEIDGAKGRLMAERGVLAAACSALEEADAQLRESRSMVEEAVRSRQEHVVFKPGLVDAIFSLGKAYREWRLEDLRLAGTVAARQTEMTRRSVERDDSARRLHEVQEHVARLAGELSVRESETAAADNLLAGLGFEVPDRERWKTNADERELSSPWADAVWNEARTEVLIQALHLHRTFLECMAARVRGNLQAAIDMLDGKVPRDADVAALRSAWETLFFVVPVISTTFASFDRLFARCGREQIGWLLIDEAGQAVPQHAAGALWRSKRALVVGDPLQLEPIVALPLKAQAALARQFGVPETWMPGNGSVQMLTDRVSRFGALVELEGHPIWVGAPLRVHRRCERPMFQIANEIAYGGLMVYDTQEAVTELPRSKWIHVRASEVEVEDNWIASEGIALEILLRDLSGRGAKGNEILLISPFRGVARRMKEIGERLGVGHVGTIHVSQGKEAEIVVLVLGGDGRRSGAREWAAERPNLLNVAVSRAKRRLYVIGDRVAWSRYGGFEVLEEWLR